MLPLLAPAHLDRDFDYLVPPELDELAQPGVRVRVRFAGRLVDGYLLARLADSDHEGKLVTLERVVSGERVLTPEILELATAVAARYAGTRADVLRLAIPPRHARTESGGTKKSADSAAAQVVSIASSDLTTARAVGDEADGEFTAETGCAPTSSAELGQVTGVSVAKPSMSPDSAEAQGESAASADVEHDSGGPNTGSAGSAEPGESRSASSKAGEQHHPVESSSADGSSEVPSPVAGMTGEQRDAVIEDLSSRPRAQSGVDVDIAPWERYVHGAAFVAALAQRKGARAAWQALPGEDWARRLAELAAVVAGQGRSAIIMVPDQRDLDRVLTECVRLVGDAAVGLAAGLGPAARYRRWLAVLRGSARVVVGTRSAVFAPARDLGLIALWDDGDDTYAEQRAPYPHAREVAMLRAHETGAAFVAAGFARTAEIQAVVDSGWAHDLVADRAVLRKTAPRISAPGDSDIALERDPVARAVRIPGVAFAAARAALKEGTPVLVQVPRRGYIPALACAKCRTPARCRHCSGPLALPEARGRRGPSTESSAAAQSPACRWCGITEAAFRCTACGSRALRAVVIGAARTAEELGRAFPGVPIRGSGGGAMLDTVEPGPQVVVATVGAEPVVPGGYGVALLLDGWALLSRADLRAAEDTLRRWMGAAALVRPHGQVIVMAEPSIPTVQALVRWDPVGAARAEVAARTEVGFPPAVRLAAIDGTAETIAELLAAADLSATVDRLGPVPLPDGARKPFSSGDSPAEVERMLLRVARSQGAALARALRAAQAVRSTHRSDAPLRVQIDPIDIG
ncbi:primosomal protein N' [Nocardia amamiensis]|uniref:primosomal protein N' n=1 Tax=Nocardia amamiensis TaxID=404578 RepID=UPI00082E53AF|nr:primosomal protein N' [Nocardia amamiensis]